MDVTEQKFQPLTIFFHGFDEMSEAKEGQEGEANTCFSASLARSFVLIS